MSSRSSEKHTAFRTGDAHAVDILLVPARSGLSPPAPDLPLPRFRLSHVPPNCDIAICEMTSDAFSREIAKDNVFDVVLIDGLHTFDQAWKDFVNSLAHVDPSRRPTWIIDDVIPQNEYVAIPSYKASKRAFKFAGRRPGLWRGDVWEMQPAFDDSQGIDFAVFESQALVWLTGGRQEVRYPTRNVWSRSDP